jgi:alanyl-tRNA synthetase
LTSAEIRRRFLEFFQKEGHRVVRSSPLIPADDPTLFFVNAGMVPFKDVFTGTEKRSYNRATSVQKCLRVSGKHNDLENVGRTPRHHTFFEMLGNFSFGNYFKAEACAFAWHFLTIEMELDPNKLWVTIYDEDDEAFDIWTKQIGVPAEHVQRMGAKDNFWSMGPVGPCGPCSEIHWDHGPSISDEEGGPATEDDRYVEIWNLVFMQFEQHADGTRTELPSPSIDTGMGLERLVAIKQGVYSNYDTDCFTKVIAKAAELAGKPYGEDEEADIAMRVIADHSRAAAFLIADGIMPSNEERGYVLRRIMRRAIRYGVKIGLSKEAFLYKTANTVIDGMGEAYPELLERKAFIEEVIRSEEDRFSETLVKGLQLLEAAMETAGETLSGEIVFKLHDTYGFPLDLTQLIAEERHLSIDEEGYHKAMEAQRAAGRAAWKGSGEQAKIDIDGDLQSTNFQGYSSTQSRSEILGLFSEGQGVECLEAGQNGILVVSETPFYAEAGGQVGDTGSIQGTKGRFEVSDVQGGKGNVTLHIGLLSTGTIKVGESVDLQIDDQRRNQIRLNHTATHLLHAALKSVLGSHVAQKGSLVDNDRLRFDFSHHKAMTQDEVDAVELAVYNQILSNTPVATELMDLDQAVSSGAMALFGEKYTENVRVVSVGGFSKELCGGTHANATGNIGLFKITSEAGVAAGVRRIEAVTGPGAFAWMTETNRAAISASQRLKSTVAQLPEALEKLFVDRKRLEKEVEGLRRELAKQASGDLLSSVREINGVSVLSAELPGDANTLRDQADSLRAKLGSGVVVLGSRENGNVILVAAATKDLASKGIHAGNIIREVAKVVGGGGGGRQDMAQAGGRDPEALPAALEKVYELVENY